MNEARTSSFVRKICRFERIYIIIFIIILFIKDGGEFVKNF